MLIERFRARQAGEMLIALLGQSDQKRVREVTALLREEAELFDVARSFQVTLGTARAARLASDIAACLLLRDRMQACQENGEIGTVANVRDRISGWTKAVANLKKAEDQLRSVGAEMLGGTLEGLASLQIVVETLVDKALSDQATAKGDRPADLHMRMVRSGVIEPLNAAIARAREEMLVGRKPSTNPLAEIQDILRVETRNPPDIGDTDEDDASDDPYLRQQARAHAQRVGALRDTLSPMFQGPDAANPRNDAAMTLKADLRGMKHGDLSKRILPSPNEAFVWSLCLLVDGWKPRVLGPTSEKPGRIAKISQHKDSYVVGLARELVMVFGEDDDAPDYQFSRTGEWAAKLWKENGGGQNPFSGRRKFGLAEGEFVPDQYDRLMVSEANQLRGLGITVPAKAVVPPIRSALRVQPRPRTAG
ncbi:MAG: hypothetical protein ACM3W4_02980 [Ignavibacteriales bacterium]